jgi:multiple sugar transport system ATP-binding protein
MSLADRISVMNQGRIVQSDNPVEVYRNPAARFVGSFIGNPPMNFLTATRAGPGQWHVGDQTVPGPQAGGDTLEFAIRPEDLRVGDQGIAVTVRVVEPLGPHTQITADAGGTVMRAVVESDLHVSPGDTLHLAPEPDRIRWFDPESTKAVA